MWPSWGNYLPFALPSYLVKSDSVMPSSFGIEWGRLTLDAMSTVILIDFVLSSYLMDQSFDRMLSRCCPALLCTTLFCVALFPSVLHYQLLNTAAVLATSPTSLLRASQRTVSAQYVWLGHNTNLFTNTSKLQPNFTFQLLAHLIYIRINCTSHCQSAQV
jgi:hypothetical protein